MFIVIISIDMRWGHQQTYLIVVMKFCVVISIKIKMNMEIEMEMKGENKYENSVWKNKEKGTKIRMKVGMELKTNRCTCSDIRLYQIRRRASRA